MIISTDINMGVQKKAKDTEKKTPRLPGFTAEASIEKTKESKKRGQYSGVVTRYMRGAGGCRGGKCGL